MSDYLQNLVTRSLNLTRVVQPRLASLFEPPVAGGVFSAAAHFDIEGAVAESHMADAASDPESRHSLPPSPQPAPRVQGTHMPLPPAQISAARRADVSPHADLSGVPSAPATEQTIQSATPPGHPFFQAAESPAREATAGRERGAADDGPTLEEQVRRVVGLELEGRASRESRSALAGRGRVVEPRLAPAPTVGPQSPQPSRGRTAMEPDAPPTIHVTIGRIDVRALISAAPQETRRPPERTRPALSLEDYLRQRNGGAR